MSRWWRDMPDWFKIVTGLFVTSISVSVVLLLIAAGVLLFRGGV